MYINFRTNFFTYITWIGSLYRASAPPPPFKLPEGCAICLASCQVKLRQYVCCSIVLQWKLAHLSEQHRALHYRNYLFPVQFWGGMAFKTKIIAQTDLIYERVRWFVFKIVFRFLRTRPFIFPVDICAAGKFCYTHCRKHFVVSRNWPQKNAHSSKIYLPLCS